MNSSQSSVNSSRLRALVFAIMLTMSAFVVPSLASHASAAGFAFSNYEISLSRNSSTPVVTCPNSNTPPNCWNVNAEPNIATAPDGTIYVSSENAAFNHPSECPNQESTPYICGGTGAWKSTDSGSHFTNLLSPNVAFVSSNPITFWGGDTDVVTGTVPNSNGYYNVYVVSLEAGGAGLIGAGLSVSQDGGQTWGPIGTVVTFTNPIADPVVTDRPWVSAIGANTVCISSHDGAANPDVYCSTDAGTSFGPPTPVFDASHAFLVSETSIPGALHIDPSNGNYIYVPFAGVSNVNEAEQDSSCGTSPLPSCPIGFHTMWVAVSTDGGTTFSDHIVYNNTDTAVSYGEQFPTIATDSSGNVYEVYSNGVTINYSISTDHGTTWNGPFQISAAGHWAVMPWITAGSAGKIDVVWYDTSGCGSGVTDVDNCAGSANWNVEFAQNLNALSTPSTFTSDAVTGTIHQGQVCLNGSGCQAYRGLFDDFGVTADPSTGLATIVYDNDMYTPSDVNNYPNPDCTGQYTAGNLADQQPCVHTDIAHQTAGTGIGAAFVAPEFPLGTILSTLAPLGAVAAYIGLTLRFRRQTILS